MLLLAACAALLSALRLVDDDPLAPLLVTILLSLFAAVPLVAWLRGALERHARRKSEQGAEVAGVWSGAVARLLEEEGFRLALLFLPWPAVFLFWLVRGQPLDFRGTPLLGWLAVWTLMIAGLCGALAFFVARGARDPRSAMLQLLWGATPWMLIPASIPLANELQAGWREVSPRSLALGSALALLSLSVVIFLGQLTTGRKRSAAPRAVSGIRSLVAGFYLPVVAGTLALFRVHIHSRHLDSVDYFHFGEVLLPNQQFLHFGKLPLIDLRLSHTFSDMFFETLYSLLIGDHGLDVMLWRLWMPAVLAVVLLYCVIARLASPGFAFLVVTLFPISFSALYAPVLLIPICLAPALERPTRARWVGVWVALLLVGLWRIDFGLASAVALGVVLIPWWLWGEVPARGSSRRQRLRVSLAALAVTAGATLLGLLALALAAGRPVFSTLSMLVRSYTFRLATRTRPEIIRAFELDAVLQYYLLPAIGLLALGLVLLRAARTREVSGRALIFAQIAAFSLIISVRSLERHSLIEGFNPYAFLLLLVLLPFLWLDRLAPRAVASSLLVIGLATLLTLPPISIERRHRVFVRPTHPAPVFRWVEWEPGEPRVTLELGRRAQLLRFLEESLDGEETFFDFTNSPLLYVLAGKRFPTWTIPNLIQTSESIQRQVVGELEALREAGDLPLVIFKQGSAFWDATDGVANEIRSYRVAEWIYEHYAPLGEVGGHQLWAEVGSALARDAERARRELAVYPLPPPDVALQRRTLELPPPEPGWLAFEALTGDPQVVLELDLAALPAATTDRAAILFDLRASVSGGVQLYVAYEDEPFVAAETVWVQVAAGTRRRVALPLPERAGSLPRSVRLRLDPPDRSRLDIGPTALQLSPGLLLPLDASQLEQHFDLHRLPKVWADFDPLEALRRTAVLAAAERPGGWQVERDAPVEVVLPPLDPDAAAPVYLQVRARSPWLADDAGLPLSLGVRQAPASIDLTLRYPGDEREAASSVTFEVIRQPLDELERLPLPLRDAHQISEQQLKDLQVEAATLGSTGARGTLFRVTGRDPGVRSFLHLEALPALEERSEVYLAFDLSSSRSGPLQLFWSFGQNHFSEARSRTVEIWRPGERRYVLVSLGARAAGARLTDVRLDPPPDTELRIFAAYYLHRRLVYDDYLLRMSSQWRWSRWLAQEGPHRLRLEASGPVEIESVLVRAAD